MTVLGLRPIDDPRGPLEKYSRKELEYLARYEGRQEVDPRMPVELMREHFRGRPPRMWPRPMFAGLGMTAGRRATPPYEQWCQAAFGREVPLPEPEIMEVNALDVVKADWERESGHQTGHEVAEKVAPAPTTPHTTAERNAAIYAASVAGVRHTIIAEKFGISAPRVSQIVSRARRQNGQNAT